MNKIVKIMAVSAAAVMAISCGGNSSKSKTEETASTEEQVFKIETATATMQDVEQEESFSSTVEANVTNNIAPQSSNRIQKINVDVGSFVTKGQILAEMDRVSYEQARLKLVNDSTELSRTRELFLQGGVSQSDYEAMELSYNVSKTSLKNLEENTILRAPVSGVISARNYDRGDMYSMGNPIFVLEQITPVKMLVGISETDYTKVKKGDAVSITAEALPGRTFTGRINKIYPTIDASSHTFSAEVIVPNTDRALRPGMYVKVTVNFGVNHSVVIPDNAVVKQQGSGQRLVYIVNGNTVKSVVVTLGKHFGDSYEILEGVSEGDVVATRGSSSLKDGSTIEIINNEQEGE